MELEQLVTTSTSHKFEGCNAGELMLGLWADPRKLLENSRDIVSIVEAVDGMEQCIFMCMPRIIW